MNVASLELSKELYELSGWEDTPADWLIDKIEDEHTRPPEVSYNSTRRSKVFDWLPAYNSGYLLRKLPDRINGVPLNLSKRGGWVAEGGPRDDGTIIGYKADTPEDALVLLAIELFKNNVLVKGEA